MKLMKYENQISPFVSPLDSIFERFNRGLPTLDRVFLDFENEGGPLPARLPRTHVQETGDAYILSLEMPGLARDDVEVNFEKDTLMIKGEKNTEAKDGENKGIVRREYHSMRYERSFNVHGVDHDKVSAKMEDGILNVTLPKSAGRLGRKVDVV